MKPIAKIICSAIVLAWWQGAIAADVTVTEQSGSVVLESVAPALAASAPAAQPAQGAPQADRVSVKPSYEKVDSARIKKRIADRAARTKKRTLDAEKDATQRAARSQQGNAGRP